MLTEGAGRVFLPCLVSQDQEVGSLLMIQLDDSDTVESIGENSVLHNEDIL